MVNPQLPASAVVTPCSGDGVRAPIPEHLGVEVGVDVDEAGRHHLAGGVDRDRLIGDLADRDDPVVLDTDVGAAAGPAGPVDDCPPEITVSSIGGPSLSFVGQMIVMNRPGVRRPAPGWDPAGGLL